MRFYVAAASAPFGTAFRHLLKVGFALGTVLAVMLVVQLVFLNGVWRWCAANLPVVTVGNGEAIAAVPQPKVIECAVNAKESFAVIIDTTGVTEGIDPKYAGGVLVKRKSIVFRDGETVLSLDYPARFSLTADRAYFERRHVRRAWIALLAAGVYPAVLGALFVQSAAAAALGTLVSRLRGAGYAFGAVLRMSFYAAALAVCFLFAVLLVGVRLNPFALIALYLFVHIAFLIGAVLSAGGGARAA